MTVARGIIVLVVIIVTSWTSAARACQCQPQGGPRVVDPAHLAAEVRVLDVIDKQTSDGRRQYGRMKIVRRWMGPPAGAKVDIQSLAGSCSFFFQKDSTVLVYAYPDGAGGGETNACGVFGGEAAKLEVALLNRGGAAPSAPEPAAPKRGGCGSCAVHAPHGDSGGFALALIAIALWARKLALHRVDSCQ